MTGWTKDSALAELKALTDQTHALAVQTRRSQEHVRWLIRCIRFLEQVFGLDSVYYQSLRALQWMRTGSVLVGGPADPMGSLDPASAMEDKHQQAYQSDLDTARGLLLAAADELGDSEVADVYRGKDTGPESSAIVKVINLAEHKLRKVFREKPQNEAGVQNAFESLLLGADLAYSRETERIEYSSKTYTPDFTMPRLDLAIEVKFCGRHGREKEIIAEINDDVLAYETKYGNLLFIVYDMGFIRDTDRFSASFEEHQNVVIRVVKH